MFVYREEYYMARMEPKDDDDLAVKKWSDRMEKVHGKTEVIIGKQRHGPIGSLDLLFKHKITKFENLGTEEDKQRYNEGNRYG